MTGYERPNRNQPFNGDYTGYPDDLPATKIPGSPEPPADFEHGYELGPATAPSFSSEAPAVVYEYPHHTGEQTPPAAAAA